MIYLFLAEGFEEVEALAPVDLLRRAGAQLRTVGVGGRRIKGSHGIEVAADLEESEVSPDDMELIILPGGMPGTKNLEASRTVRMCLETCARRGRRIAAICAAPSILGHLGLLKGHRAVCFPGYENELGADEVPMDPVCVSGTIITARGAGVAVEFGLKIIEELFGAEKSLEIRKKIQCI